MILKTHFINNTAHEKGDVSSLITTFSLFFCSTRGSFFKSQYYAEKQREKQQQ